MEGWDAVFELFDGIFLIASLVDKPDELGIGGVFIVGDVEKVSDLMIDDFASFCDLQVLFQGDDPIGFFAFDRSIRKRGDRFFDGLNVLIASLYNAFLFDISRLAPRLRFDLICRTLKAGPGIGRQQIGFVYQGFPRIVTKDKPHTLCIPSVEVHRE